MKKLNKILVGVGIVLASLFIMGFEIYNELGHVQATRKNSFGCICHDYFASPDVHVWIEGPDTVQLGKPERYSIRLTGGPAIAGGYNVAAGHGMLAVIDTSSIILWSELTHSSPQTFVTDTVRWDFLFSGTSVGLDTLFSSGNSVNADRIPTSDHWNFGDDFILTVIDRASSVISQTVSADWNIISLSVDPLDGVKTHIFPTAISRAYAYEGTYLPKETLRSGQGYWLKFPADTVVKLSGLPVELDTVDVRIGWNIIGSISFPVAVTTIASLPGGIVASNFFGFDGSKYFITDTIHPGHGYWVRVNTDGRLLLSQSASASGSNCIRIAADGEFPPPPPGETSVEHRTSNIPTEFALEQNYPNPFNPTTSVRYAICDVSHVTLNVFDVLGREVVTLVNEVQEPGYMSVHFNASNVTSGLYFYRMTARKTDGGQAETFSETKKLLIIK